MVIEYTRPGTKQIAQRRVDKVISITPLPANTLFVTLSTPENANPELTEYEITQIHQALYLGIFKAQDVIYEAIGYMDSTNCGAITWIEASEDFRLINYDQYVGLCKSMNIPARLFTAYVEALEFGAVLHSNLYINNRAYKHLETANQL